MEVLTAQQSINEVEEKGSKVLLIRISRRRNRSIGKALRRRRYPKKFDVLSRTASVRQIGKLASLSELCKQRSRIPTIPTKEGLNYKTESFP